LHLLPAPCYKRAVVEGRPDGVEASGPVPTQQQEPMLLCPRCAARLCARQCKLVCERCGYYMSCSDFI